MTLGQADAQLFTALAKEAEQRLGDFNPQVLANTAWAFATLGQADAQLFTALAREAEQHLGDFNPVTGRLRLRRRDAFRQGLNGASRKHRGPY